MTSEKIYNIINFSLLLGIIVLIVSTIITSYVAIYVMGHSDGKGQAILECIKNKDKRPLME